MTRLQADLLLLLTACIWGLAFVAQKTGMESVGPFTFVAARFAITVGVFLPVFLFDVRRHGSLPAGAWGALALLGMVFSSGMIAQQVGIKDTSVTNAGFLTGLYVVFTPFATWLLSRRPPRAVVWVAAAVSMSGVYLLAVPKGLAGGLAGGLDGGLEALSRGDGLVVLSAVMFGLHFPVISRLLESGARPLQIAFYQYVACAIVAALLMGGFETVTLGPLADALPELLYAAIPAGAIGFALQAMAQQHAPPSDTAIVLSSEALFAALAGALLLGDRLTALGWVGCGLILGAILLVELFPRRR